MVRELKAKLLEESKLSIIRVNISSLLHFFVSLSVCVCVSVSWCCAGQCCIADFTVSLLVSFCISACVSVSFCLCVSVSWCCAGQCCIADSTVSLLVSLCVSLFMSVCRCVCQCLCLYVCVWSQAVWSSMTGSKWLHIKLMINLLLMMMMSSLLLKVSEFLPLLTPLKGSSCSEFSFHCECCCCCKESHDSKWFCEENIWQLYWQWNKTIKNRNGMMLTTHEAEMNRWRDTWSTCWINWILQ